MSNTITVVGNISEPDFRFTPSGKPVLNMSLADNHSRFDKQKNEWEQTGTSWYRLTLWDAHAQNGADALKKGDHVIVTGRAETRTFTDKDGQERESREIQVHEIGKVISKRDTQQQQSQGSGGSQAQSDPWAGQPQGQGGWDAPQGGSPPF